MHEISELDERRELGRRRGLAMARGERESQRKVLLGKLIRTEHRADQLRRWIAGQQSRIAAMPDADLAWMLTRMLEWARAELAELEAIVDPVQLAETLRERDLFPKVDRLADPLSEPPPQLPWGR
jgi:hypothetical protein